MLVEKKLYFGDTKCDYNAILNDEVTLMDYVNQYKLPSDRHSMENATMLFNSFKYCLLIDPEQQGLTFLKNYYS